MNDHPDKKGCAWHWRPLRVAGSNRIAVMRGRRVVLLMHAHDLDDAHTLCQLRNLAAGVIKRVQ
ncbi:MAG TPA: hypothetical protein PKD46_16800 [Aggregatilineaceae bacterium]|mgnify:CR=1 FL=1|nr:hypothetical protein [Aggregatilineaceae bacterium]